LEKKQHLEFVRAEAAIKSILANPENAEKLLESKEGCILAILGTAEKLLESEKEGDISTHSIVL
jgi:hypothetical protein